MGASEPLVLRVGGQTVAAAPSPALRPAIEAANRTAHIDGLPDTLNPGIIDPAKAERFIAALPGQPEATLARAAGLELPLNWPGLGVLAAYPTRVAAFDAPLTLIIDDIQGRHLMAHTSVPADIALAQSRAHEAQAAVSDAQRAVQQAERAAAAGPAVGAARGRRSAAALTWRMNARIWAQAAPQDRAAQDAFAAAQKAARAYDRPGGALAE